MKIDPNKISLNPYAAAIYYHLKDREVEVYGGDAKTTLKFNDYDYSPKNMIVGIVKEVMGDCLILEVKGQSVFLNVWGIKAILPVSDSLSLKNVYRDDEFSFNRRYGA